MVDVEQQLRRLRDENTRLRGALIRASGDLEKSKQALIAEAEEKMKAYGTFHSQLADENVTLRKALADAQAGIERYAVECDAARVLVDEALAGRAWDRYRLTAIQAHLDEVLGAAATRPVPLPTPPGSRAPIPLPSITLDSPAPAATPFPAPSPESATASAGTAQTDDSAAWGSQTASSSLSSAHSPVQRPPPISPSYLSTSASVSFLAGLPAAAADPVTPDRLTRLHRATAEANRSGTSAGQLIQSSQQEADSMTTDQAPAVPMPHAALLQVPDLSTGAPATPPRLRHQLTPSPYPQDETEEETHPPLLLPPPQLKRRVFTPSALLPRASAAPAASADSLPQAPPLHVRTTVAQPHSQGLPPRTHLAPISLPSPLPQLPASPSPPSVSLSPRVSAASHWPHAPASPTSLSSSPPLQPLPHRLPQQPASLLPATSPWLLPSQPPRAHRGSLSPLLRRPLASPTGVRTSAPSPASFLVVGCADRSSARIAAQREGATSPAPAERRENYGNAGKGEDRTEIADHAPSATVSFLPLLASPARLFPPPAGRATDSATHSSGHHSPARSLAPLAQSTVAAEAATACAGGRLQLHDAVQAPPRDRPIQLPRIAGL